MGGGLSSNRLSGLMARNEPSATGGEWTTNLCKISRLQIVKNPGFVVLSEPDWRLAARVLLAPRPSGVPISEDEPQSSRAHAPRVLC
jgi:hypothetical protein